MADKFDPAKYQDTYSQEVQKLIEAKAKGQKRRPAPPKAAKSNVIDLVAALQESLGTVKKGKKRTAA
jgi:DNA end-binding protein Ku